MPDIDSTSTKPFRCAFCKVKYSATHPKYFTKLSKRPYCSTTCLADADWDKQNYRHYRRYGLSIEEFVEQDVTETIW